MKINYQLILGILFGVCAVSYPLWASNQQDDGRTYYTVNQASANMIGSGYGSAGTGTPFNYDGTGFFRLEFPAGAITNSEYSDDGVWYELGGLGTGSGTLTAILPGDGIDVDANPTTPTVSVDVTELVGLGITNSGNDFTVDLAAGGGLDFNGNDVSVTPGEIDVTQLLNYQNWLTTVAITASAGLTGNGTGGSPLSVVPSDIDVTQLNNYQNWLTTVSVSDPLTGNGTGGSPIDVLNDGIDTTMVDWGRGANQIYSGSVPTNTDNFNGVLSAAEDDTQKALDILDDLTLSDWGTVPVDTQCVSFTDAAAYSVTSVATGYSSPVPVCAQGTITYFGLMVQGWAVVPIGTDTLTVYLYKNGVSADSFTSTAGAGGVVSKANASVAVSANDYIQIWVKLTAAGSTDIITVGGASCKVII